VTTSRTAVRDGGECYATACWVSPTGARAATTTPATARRRRPLVRAREPGGRNSSPTRRSSELLKLAREGGLPVRGVSCNNCSYFPARWRRGRRDRMLGQFDRSACRNNDASHRS